MEFRPPGSLMLTEIQEQPAVLNNLIDSAGSALHKVAEHARGCRFAVLVARGSSDNASTYGKYLLEGLAGLPTALASPSLFTLYHTPPRLADALVIGVSQSGQAADVVEVVHQARRQGALTLAITNTPDSPLAEAAEHVLLLEAGVEKALAATKTVTTECVAYALLATTITQNVDLFDGLHRLPDAISSVLAQEDHITTLAREWLEAERTIILGRGYSYGAAQESALKLKETCYINAESFSAADFMHGPLAIIEPGYPVLALLSHDATQDAMLALIRQVQSRGARVVTFATRQAAPLPENGRVLNVECSTALLSTIPFIVAGQLFAMHLSVMKGFDPDISRGLHKVTITL